MDAVPRQFTDEDSASVLSLIDGDLLPGRPSVTPAVLRLALAGLFPGSRAAGLERPQTEVLTSHDGQVVGVVSHTTRGDGTGLLLWLHCLDDDERLAQVLLGHAQMRLGRRTTVHAFTEATLLAPAGLAVRNRPGTRRALEAAGFSGTDRWRYLRHRLATLSPWLFAVVDLSERSDAPGWRLCLQERSGRPIGEVRTGPPIQGSVHIEGITLADSRRFLGHVLLDQCLVNLADRGIREVTTCLEAPSTDRPRSYAVRHLHEAVGFVEIDQLHTYIRRP
ncbi:GNAT family N-acetyltransferase [Streptomyces wuyuanensis]|uniref:GNAT family N-acetyltransferase n=1 Tax=Streptomyces wuyuanensis TaxID=1196353 RepID=UPI0036B158DF